MKYKEFLTPISETFQTLVWHLLVTHPNLKKNKDKVVKLNKAIFLDRDGTLNKALRNKTKKTSIQFKRVENL